MICDQNPKIQHLPIADIEVEEDHRLRPISEAGVESLIASIRDLGTITDAIHVRRKRRSSGTRLVLIAGGHRLEAAKRLDWSTIPARVWADITDIDARLMEIDDNLAGKPLDPLDQAEFLVERKRVYEQAHPETKKGLAGASARWNATANLAVASFVKATAEATGLSERNIYRRVAVGEQLSREDIQTLRAAPGRIKAGELDALAKLDDPSERSEVIAQIAAGEAPSVTDAIAQLRPNPTILDPDQPAFDKLVVAWKRAPMRIKRQFVADRGGEIDRIRGVDPGSEGV